VSLIVVLSGSWWSRVRRASEFPRLERTKAYRHPSRDSARTSDIWAINCLFLDKDVRGQGLSARLVEAAVKAIRKRRGRTIEAYPVTLTKNGKKLPAAFAFTGPEIIYQRLGFKEAQRLAPSRPLYCLELS